MTHHHQSRSSIPPSQPLSWSVRSDPRGRPVRPERMEPRSSAQPDRQALLALLGVMELMVGMVLMLWAVLLVLSALLVAAVSKAHQGLTERQAPPVRRVPPGYRAQRGSRVHRVPMERRPRQ